MPIVYAATILSVLGLFTAPVVIFVESFCRVTSMSLTGKLLYYMADRFVVQWPELQRKYPKRTEYVGVLC